MSDFFDNDKPLVISAFENGVRLPEFKPTQRQYDYVGLPNTANSKEFLLALTRLGFKEFVKNSVEAAKYTIYIDRVKEEIKVIEELGFIDYILMVWDICDFCRTQKIPMGRGRGSVGSSLVCYLIGITKVDSVKYGTFFTRFLSKSRAKYKIIDGVKYIDGSLAPDIDQDLCYFRRSEVIDYLNEKYEGRVCKLLTSSTLSAKMLIKDVVKKFGGHSEDEADFASKLLKKTHGVVEEISDALSDDPKKENVEFKQWGQNHKETLKIACALSGLTRGFGIHASAVAISFDKIEKLLPLQLSKPMKKSGDDDDDEEDDVDDTGEEVTAGYDMYTAQEIVLKFDELGLKTASLVDDIWKTLGKSSDEFNVDDEAIYKYLSENDDYYGIFQFESRSQGEVGRKIKPKTFKHIVDALSISRPGASAYLGQYLDYIHRGIYKPIHPIIDATLKDTGGVCLFQETLLKMLNAVGMELDDCEQLRKVIGKKLVDKMPEWEAKIYGVCEKNGHPKDVAKLIWEIADASSGYQFGLAHSVGYGMLTAETAYLKAKYPREFFLGCLRMARRKTDKTGVISKISMEMNRAGLKLLPPDLMLSDLDFKIEKDGIRFGLSAIKGLGGKAISKLSLFKTEHATKLDALNAAKSAGLNIGALSAMIQCGCLSSFSESRSRLVLEAQTYNSLSDGKKTLVKDRAAKYNYDILKTLASLKDEKNEKGKNVFPEKQWENFMKKYSRYKKIYEVNHANEEYACYYYEKQLLGFSFSTRLIDIFGKFTDNLMPLQEIGGETEGVYVRGVGSILEIKAGVSKKKTPYVRMLVGDEKGSITLMVFTNAKSDNIQKMKDTNDGELPTEKSVIIFTGMKKDGDTVFADKVGIQDFRIYMKLGELTKDEKEDESS